MERDNKNENDNENPSIITFLLKQFAVIFTLSILSMSLSTILFSSLTAEAKMQSAIFVLEGQGLPFNIIFQAAGFSIVMAFFVTFLFWNNQFAKLTLLVKYILFLFITLVVTIIFAVFFNWFPVNNYTAWLFFLVGFITCTVTAIGFSYLYARKTDKKYNKLLEEYKKRNSGNK